MNEIWRRIKHKFKAKPVRDTNGHFYASGLEHKYKMHLDLMKNANLVLFYLEQVPLRLPGGTKYVIDFMVFYVNGDVSFVDVKGIETDTFKIKKREIEAIYPFKIEVIKKGDF